MYWECLVFKCQINSLVVNIPKGHRGMLLFCLKLISSWNQAQNPSVNISQSVKILISTIFWTTNVKIIWMLCSDFSSKCWWLLPYGTVSVSHDHSLLWKCFFPCPPAFQLLVPAVKLPSCLVVILDIFYSNENQHLKLPLGCICYMGQLVEQKGKLVGGKQCLRSGLKNYAFPWDFPMF